MYTWKKSHFARITHPRLASRHTKPTFLATKFIVMSRMTGNNGAEFKIMFKFDFFWTDTRNYDIDFTKPGAESEPSNMRLP